MKLYLISQSEVKGFDFFDSAVVVAPDEETARRIHPQVDYSRHPIIRYTLAIDGKFPRGNFISWCASVDQVKVRYLGEASAEFNDIAVICASFNEG